LACPAPLLLPEAEHLFLTVLVKKGSLTLAPRYPAMAAVVIPQLPAITSDARTCTALIVVAIATAVMVMATAVIVMATAVELASNGPLGRLPVSDVNVEPVRVFTKRKA
jgi:hypothetical protein